MKVKIIKDHPTYSGTVEVDEARGKYLIAVGAAEEVKAKKEKKEVEEEVTEKKRKNK